MGYFGSRAPATTTRRSLARLLATTIAISALLGVGIAPAAADANHPPVANDDPTCGQPPSTTGDSFPVAEDINDWFVLGLGCAPLANDTDADGDVLTWEMVGLPSHGSALKVDETMAAYRSDPDYSTLGGDEPGGTWLSDSFTYRAFDGQDYSNVATYRIWVAPINDPPTFTPGGTVMVDEDSGPYSEQWATDVSPGPTNESGQQVAFERTSMSTLPGLFTVSPTIASDGTLTFTPAPGKSGLTQVTFRAKDDGGLNDQYSPAHIFPLMTRPDDTSDEVSFTIWVKPVVDIPIPHDDAYQVQRDSGTTGFDVRANDSDEDSLVRGTVLVDGGTLGTAVVNFGTYILYTPNPNTTGVDTFTYALLTDSGLTQTATVTVTITGPNRPPVATADDKTIAEGSGATAIDVLSNDSDVDGDPLTVTDASDGLHGAVAIIGGGTGVTYTPAALFHGSDSFIYTVSDGHGGTATGTASITVSNDATPPVVTGLTQAFPSQTLGLNTVNVKLAWSGSDAGSGIASYRLQVSVDGGRYSTVALPSPASTSVTRTLTIGKVYRFRVRASDGASNSSVDVAWPSVTPARFQESSSLATRTGIWGTTRSSHLSGGRSRFTSSATRRLTFAFIGRDVGLVATKRNVGGRAQVRIDGRIVATIDLDAASTHYRGLVFHYQFAAKGPHTLELRPVGDGRVEVDAFVVLR